jgi:hypothetical protein
MFSMKVTTGFKLYESAVCERVASHLKVRGDKSNLPTIKREVDLRWNKLPDITRNQWNNKN